MQAHERPRSKGSIAISVAFRSLWAVLAANFLFALLSMILATANSAPVARKVSQAFASGDLLPVDWRDKDSVRGANSYNECLILQMAINDQGSVFEKAFLPRIYVWDDEYRGGCATLREIAVGNADLARLYSDTYSRYWHGYVPVGSVLTRALGVAGMRTALKISTYGALVLLFVVAVVARGRLAVLGVAIACVGGTVWALPYYGQNISYAPGDACVILGLAIIILLRKWIGILPQFAGICAIYGAVLTYFDFLTGQLATGAGLLFAVAYTIGRQDGASIQRGWTLAIIALTSMIFGATLTVVIKQAIVIALVGADGVAKLTNNLAYYTGIGSGQESGVALYVHAFRYLFENAYFLTYNHAHAGMILLCASGLSWLLALGAAVRNRHYGDFIAFGVAASAVPAWVFLMPRHTIQEAFMVRILIVPIALGVAIFVQYTRGVAADMISSERSGH